MPKDKLQWHPAFQAALQIELEEDKPYLKFYSEYNLTKKPMQIDTLILKAEKWQCKKNLAKFFRGHNIIEYKSPRDSFSVNDFYKLTAYAGYYQSDTEGVLEITPGEITLTIVCSQYPRAMLRHIKERFGVTAEKVYPGIYYIENGLLFPLQIVVSGRLDPEEYVWLSRLRYNLTVEEDIDRLSRAYSGKEKDPLYEAVMELIMRANQKQYEEAKDMCKALRELFAEELEQARAQGLSQGLSQGSAGGIGYIRSMYLHRLSVESIAELINQSREYVSNIIELITKYPGEDDVMIARRFLK